MRSCREGVSRGLSRGLQQGFQAELGHLPLRAQASEFERIVRELVVDHDVARVVWANSRQALRNFLATLQIAV